MKKQIQFKIRSKWCLALLFAMFSATTYSQQSLRDQFNVDAITYKIASPTEVEVVGYTGTAKEVTVPQTSNDQGTDYTVTAIGNDAFKEKGLTNVTIPANVEIIGLFPFQDKQDLHLVTVEANHQPVINHKYPLKCLKPM